MVDSREELDFQFDEDLNTSGEKNKSINDGGAAAPAAPSTSEKKSEDWYVLNNPSKSLLIYKHLIFKQYLVYI